MNINSVGVNKVINVYNDANKRGIEKKSDVKKSDSIEISNIGKSLSSFGLEKNLNISKERLDSLSNQVSNGTYKVDSSVLASKLLSVVKGNEV